jgi:hypothetical protein
MSVDTYYFSHDYNTRSNQKIKNLLQKHGATGYGLFWMIIEDLYNNANALRSDYDSIAYDLRSDSETIRSIINDFDLFIVKRNIFGSPSVQKRLDKRKEKSEKAKLSAMKRWENDNISGKPEEKSQTESNTDAMRSHTDSNAIKERKGKEIKENISKSKQERLEDFKLELESYKEVYGSAMIQKFFNYWVQSNPADKKMLFEKQKAFEISRRLITWKNIDDGRNTNSRANIGTIKNKTDEKFFD